MKNLLIIFSFSLLLILMGRTDSRGQLITDSESKLKTQTSGAKRGFSLFKKKKSADPSKVAQQNNQRKSPKYSKGSPFASFNNRKSANPRVSRNRETLFKSYQNKAPRYSSSGLARIMSNGRSPAPRYSTGKVLTSHNRTTVPRYSAGKPFTSRDLNVSPRYSAGEVLTSSKGATSPRYSVGKPVSSKPSKAAPRYSVGNVFSKKEKIASPRYSPAKFERSKKLQVEPRYSPGSPFEGVSWAWIKPKYSVDDNSKFLVDKKKRAKYVYEGIEANFQGFSRKRVKWAEGLENILDSRETRNFKGRTKIARFDPQERKDVTTFIANSSTQAARFDPKESKDMSGFSGSTRVRRPGKEQNNDVANYTGDFKQKWIKDREMHPSFNANKANQDSETMRNSLRKLNLLWTRVNGNKQQPNAVTDKISKPKFDRKEAEIWNE